MEEADQNRPGEHNLPDRRGLAGRLRVGLWVIIALMIIEIVEYLVGVLMTDWSFPILFVLAIPGAGFIIYYFMHITQLWRPGE